MGLFEVTCGYVTALDLTDTSFDLTGAEGAIYNHAFPSGKRAGDRGRGVSVD